MQFSTEPTPLKYVLLVIFLATYVPIVTYAVGWLHHFIVKTVNKAIGNEDSQDA